MTKKSFASLKKSLIYDKVKFDNDPEYKNYILQTISLIISNY
jgi:hypothetical protein